MDVRTMSYYATSSIRGTAAPVSYTSGYVGVDATMADDLNRFSALGEYAPQAYSAVMDMKRPDGTFFVSMASRRSKGGEITNDALLLDVVQFILQYSREGLQVGTPEAWYEGIQVLDNLVREGKSAPWDLPRDAMLQLARAYTNRVNKARVILPGIPTDKPCPHNRCGYLEYTYRSVQLSSLDEGAKGINYCCKCGKKRPDIP